MPTPIDHAELVTRLAAVPCCSPPRSSAPVTDAHATEPNALISLAYVGAGCSSPGSPPSASDCSAPPEAPTGELPDRERIADGQR